MLNGIKLSFGTACFSFLMFLFQQINGCVFHNLAEQFEYFVYEVSSLLVNTLSELHGKPVKHGMVQSAGCNMISQQRMFVDFMWSWKAERQSKSWLFLEELYLTQPTKVGFY